MKPKIHPTMHRATVICACGNTFETYATKEQLKVDLCSNCHPFYTGQQRIVDAEGRVERFMRRMAKVQVKETAAAPKVAAAAPKR